MKRFAVASALVLNLALVAPVLAQQPDSAPNANQSRKTTRAELKQQEKSEKAQAKADKEERKALNTKQAKKAAKDQDKANVAQPQ